MVVRPRWQLVSGVCAVVGLACGVGPEEAAVTASPQDAHTRSAIINGEACTEDTLESTVAILVDGMIDLGGFQLPLKNVVCTGTLIAPDVVLTAAHCVDPAALSGGFGTVSTATFYVTSAADMTGLATGQSMDFPADAVVVAEPLKHPEFDINNLNGMTVNGPGAFKDVGLIFLSAPFPRVPARVITAAEAVNVMVAQQPLDIAGWGQQQPGASNPLQPPPAGSVGVKICAQSFINEVGTHEFQVGAGPDTSRKCHGDSGGPSYVTLDGKKVVVGITSHAYDASDCDKGGVDTRVDVWLPWIEQEMTARCSNNTRVWCDVPGVPPPDFNFTRDSDGGVISAPDAGPTDPGGSSSSGGGNNNSGGSGGDAPGVPGCNSLTSVHTGLPWAAALLLAVFGLRSRRRN